MHSIRRGLAIASVLAVAAWCSPARAEGALVVDSSERGDGRPPRRLLLALDDALGGGRAMHVLVDDLVFAVTGDVSTVPSNAIGKPGPSFRLSPMKLAGTGYGFGAFGTF